MTQLHVTIEAPDVKTAGELKDELLEHYKSSIFGIKAKECSVFINTVLSDETWADITKSFSKNKSATLSIEDEPESHSIYDE